MWYLGKRKGWEWTCLVQWGNVWKKMEGVHAYLLLCHLKQESKTAGQRQCWSIGLLDLCCQPEQWNLPQTLKFREKDWIRDRQLIFKHTIRINQRGSIFYLSSHFLYPLLFPLSHQPLGRGHYGSNTFRAAISHILFIPLIATKQFSKEPYSFAKQRFPFSAGWMACWEWLPQFGTTAKQPL